MWYKQNNFGISTWKSDTCQNYSIIQMHSKFYVREKSMQNDWNYVACANACDGFQSLIDAKQWISKNKSTYPEILCMTFSSTKNRTQILAANTKDLAANLSRVRSSNIWSYGFNMKDRHDKTGDIVVQFKNKTVVQVMCIFIMMFRLLCTDDGNLLPAKVIISGFISEIYLNIAN